MLTRVPTGRQLAPLDPPRVPEYHPDRDPDRYSAVVRMPRFAAGFRPGFRIVRLD